MLLHISTLRIYLKAQLPRCILRRWGVCNYIVTILHRLPQCVHPKKLTELLIHYMYVCGTIGYGWSYGKWRFTDL